MRQQHRPLGNLMLLPSCPESAAEDVGSLARVSSLARPRFSAVPPAEWPAPLRLPSLSGRSSRTDLLCRIWDGSHSSSSSSNWRRPGRRPGGWHLLPPGLRRKMAASVRAMMLPSQVSHYQAAWMLCSIPLMMRGQQGASTRDALPLHQEPHHTPHCPTPCRPAQQAAPPTAAMRYAFHPCRTFELVFPICVPPNNPNK